MKSARILESYNRNYNKYTKLLDLLDLETQSEVLVQIQE